MIANFFQNLDARRVEYLLISGQATVLYGAATFSEDIDLWINPTEDNCRRLVELKKTQRLEDYPIISKLALAWFDQPECEQPTADFRWAIENIFTLPELRIFLEEHPTVLEALPANSPPGFKEFAEQIVAGKDESEASAASVNADMQRRMAELQQADRRYWRNIIAELKRLRAAGELMSEGDKV